MIEKDEAERWNVVTSKKARRAVEKTRSYKRDITNAEFNFYLADFFQEMEKGQQESFSGNCILEFLATVDKKYSLNEEQDAEELLLTVIDMLSEGERVSLQLDV